MMNLPVQKKHIMILTGEPSGDMHGASLVQQIKKLNPDILFSGIGGHSMRKENVDLFFNIERLSVMGFTEILMQFSQIKQAFNLFRENIRIHKPDLLIIIDYPGFNLKAAQYAKEKYNIRVLYYITPKVWAWKKSRLKKIKQFADHCALILPFEERLFKKSKIPCTYVGNPLVDIYPENESKPFFNYKKVKEDNHITIGLLPGSRKTEVKNLGPIMGRTINKLHQSKKSITFLISKADAISHSLLLDSMKTIDKGVEYEILDGPVNKIFLKADLLIAASGTVTLEAALSCIPTIIIYKVSYLSYRIAKFLVTIKYAGLANLIVDQEVMPELLQYDATPDKISKKALSMLRNLKVYEQKLSLVRKRLGTSGASRRTAQIALSIVHP